MRPQVSNEGRTTITRDFLRWSRTILASLFHYLISPVKKREIDYYYNMSELLPEDYSLRQRLVIHHLYHDSNLGSPDNLVFVTEYIEHLKDKLTRNECIYCEKTFGDRNVLMDHM
ncbi:unnamed protein product [Cylicocyclus nassatus]|uniref:ZN622/Rei1/Reh1 zinc finger C2H2-type domain-containing protein n=1 Tax=Cylicocyclus nassatus TaxID=53992 RepID=A0AA36MG42_CYLNA|nr:unnamed protein product [Cylicocyclus nassatus]